MNSAHTSSDHSLPKIDYLLIGHITQDLTLAGIVLGGTVSYSAMAAAAMGLRVGIVTVAPGNVDLTALAAFPIQRIDSSVVTTFENIATPNGRIQYLHQRARTITAQDIPAEWQDAPLVHFGPVAYEIDPGLMDIFPHSFLGITLQGCLRAEDKQHLVHYQDWKDAQQALPKCNAAVISVEDVEYQEERINTLIKLVRIFVVTEGAEGARVYWNGDVRRFRAPLVPLVDATGAGDIFAAVFFTRLHATRDPWLACAQAVQLASLSVTRRGVEGVPTIAEVQNVLAETIPVK
jgi:sugar/nucleoside kinase (ribokinase family)